MELPYTFPFGNSVCTVEQQDRTAKRIFVLGVYASAVHARWIDPNGKTRITALAVASEPYIFWKGDNAAKIVDEISISKALGKLIPAAANLNGPSGNALDERFLEPLGLTRADAWLCDLVPHSCMNPRQQAAIDRAYTPVVAAHNLKSANLPSVPKTLADAQRKREILAEVVESRAETLILLGDQPIQWFLHDFDKRTRLANFGAADTDYGRLHEVQIAGKSYRVLPLVHPRQAAKLGSHSSAWSACHEYWVTHTASVIAEQLKE